MRDEETTYRVPHDYDVVRERVVERRVFEHVIRKVSGKELALLENDRGNSSSNNAHILEETDDKFTFPAGALVAGNNVITIVQDNMGLNETGGKFIGKGE